jgi:hypothetical protein
MSQNGLAKNGMPPKAKWVTEKEKWNKCNQDATAKKLRVAKIDVSSIIV